MRDSVERDLAVAEELGHMADARIKELEQRNAQPQQRVKAFQEGYRDKAFEVTALEIQLMDCRAYGADKVTARNNESLRTKLLAACIERNEAREEVGRLREALERIQECAQGIMPNYCDMDQLREIVISLNDARWTRLYAILAEARAAISGKKEGE